MLLEELEPKIPKVPDYLSSNDTMQIKRFESIPYTREPYRRMPLGRVRLDERRLDEVHSSDTLGSLRKSICIS